MYVYAFVQYPIFLRKIATKSFYFFELERGPKKKRTEKNFVKFLSVLIIES